MLEYPYVLSEYDEINSLLYQPINSTQRIKYTCFNTSSNYIVLGSTSGSIYLFSRKPCSFLQLIPLSEGAVTRLLISPDEKTIALATTRGSVCLVALKPTPKLIVVSTEHVHEQINCLCWSDNSTEIYIGDGAGKVSVMVLTIFTVNGMFQAPACVLMNLDSRIVQLNFSAPLLLVSTLTRCYVCDTVQEQYKQIGNKGRNGEFGACFYKTYPREANSSSFAQTEEKQVNRKRLFSFIPETDNNLQEGNFPKIFCARPGSRLWEVSANGVVVKTHQFKEALAVPAVTVCRRNAKRAGHKNRVEETWLPQSINFSHLFLIAEKYLFLYTSNSLYIINPASATVVLWTDEFANIAMAETVENRIYLMKNDGEFHCLTFSSLDSLIVRLYNRKRYYECLETCLAYRHQLQQLISETEITKISNIESKSRELRSDELSTILHPIIRLVQPKLDTSPKKLDSGIVVVHSGNTDLNNEETFREKFQVHSSSPSSRTATKVQTSGEAPGVPTDFSNDANCNTASLESENCNEITPTTKDESNLTQRVQSDLETIYALASRVRPGLSGVELEKIILDVEERMNAIKDSYETSLELKNFAHQVTFTAELYYFTTLLENTSVQTIRSASAGVLNELVKAFVKANEQSYTKCTCGHSFPTSQLAEPKFLGVGRSLLKRFMEESEEESTKLCNRVPYLWREYLPVYVERQGVQNELLRQCLQIRDNTVLSFLLPLLDAKQWTVVATCFTELKEGRCLFCTKSVKEGNCERVIDWTDVTREIIKKQGPDVAMTFLTKLEKAIPNVPIDMSIFQSLVFTKLLYQHGKKCAVDFNKSTVESSQFNTMCSTKVRDQLIEVLEKDLGRKINKSIFGDGAHHWGMRYQNQSSTCPCCTLSLQTPVLLGNSGIAIFGCGHAYHVNCMIEKKLTTCNLHT